MQTTCRNWGCLQSLVNSCFLIGYCRMGNGRSQRGKKQQTYLLSTKQNSKQFSCIVGSSRSRKLFKKYLAQIEHLFDMMEKWILYSVISPVYCFLLYRQYTHENVYLYIYIYIHIHIYILHGEYVCVRTHTHTYIHIDAHTYIHI